MTQHHKLKKKHKDAEIELNKLKDQLEGIRMKIYRCLVHEIICNLQKSIKKTKEKMKNITNVKD